MSMSAEAKARKAKNNKAYRLANKEKIAEYTKAYRLANKEKIAETDKAYRLTNKEAKSEYDKAYNQENKEKKLAYAKEYQQANKEKVAEYKKAYYLANKAKSNERTKAYHQENREKALETNKAWRQNNRDIMNTHGAKHRAAKLERTVSWADSDAIKALYTEAQRLTEETGEQHHVDHIIPLRGKLVSGLHVENNLQVLTAYDNLSKSNTFNIEENV